MHHDLRRCDAVLADLLADLILLSGPDDPETQEVQELLRHLDED